MRGLLGKLIGWLRGRRDYRPINVRFELPDPQKIRGDLGLQAEAQRRGRENLPALEADNLDDVEQRIVSEIETYKTKSFETYSENRESHAASLRALVSRPLEAQVLTTPTDAQAEFEREVREGSDELHTLHQFAVDVSRELDDFRRKEKISRAADYPESKSLRIGLVCVLAFLEALANTFFFAEGSDFGLVGGFVLALLAATTNVLIGFAAGYFPARWRNSRRLLVSMSGLLFLCLYFPFMIIFNLGIAHYRTALVVGDAASAFNRAIASLRTNPLQIGSYESSMLLIIGVAFSLIAFVDGYRLDDPYPGYGRLARRRDSSLEDFREIKTERTETLQKLKDEKLAIVDESAIRVERRRLEFQEIRERSRMLTKQFEQYLYRLEQIANELLQSYREANRSTRQSPIPPHFLTRWTMQMPDLEGPLLIDTQAFEKETELTVRRLADGRIAIINAFESALRSFQSVSEIADQAAAESTDTTGTDTNVREKTEINA